MKLCKIFEGTYFDQYGFEHECLWVDEVVEVKDTGEVKEREYYNAILKDQYFSSDCGRKWLCFVATDYGAPRTWSLVGDNSQKWIRYEERQKTYGRKPLIKRQSDTGDSNEQY